MSEELDSLMADKPKRRLKSSPRSNLWDFPDSPLAIDQRQWIRGWFESRGLDAPGDLNRTSEEDEEMLRRMQRLGKRADLALNEWLDIVDARTLASLEAGE